MSIKDEVRIPQWALAIVVTILVATHGGIWVLRESRISDLEKEISTYKQSNEWKLPETLNKINSASEKLSLNIDQKNKLTRLEAESKESLIKNKELGDKLEEAKLKLNAANQALTQLTTENKTFTVNRRDSHQIAGDLIYLSVNYVGSSNVMGIFDNKEYDLELGKSLPYSIGALNCKITLTKMSMSEEFATFNQSCISSN
ncbi:hypothetical protein [Pantoea agglomerans]|uniref:hypothetical protein n=1 Tax=Enterobacter agglomerans TaxID=549 RepID=UPI0016541C87|nr:hypothetical protein [Pantoea agglomerans]